MLDNLIKEDALNAFNAINGDEYRCALAESQTNDALFNQVKKEYGIAESAFLQGVQWALEVNNKEIERVVEATRQEQMQEDFKMIADVLSIYEKIHQRKLKRANASVGIIIQMQLDAIKQITNAINKVYEELKEGKQ